MDLVSQQFAGFLEQIDTPRSLTVSLMLRHKEWDQLASLKLSPANYLNADSYRMDAICTSFLKKCEELPTTIDREMAAIHSWLEAERQCCTTNIRLTPFLHNGPFEGRDAELLPFIQRVREKIQRILGRAPTELHGRFGPGATATDPSVHATVAHKCSSNPSITPDALHVLPMWSRTAWARYSHDQEITVLDTATFRVVPKNCLTGRSISIEPSINVYYQLAVGGEIRKRLKEYGLDLQTAQSLHRDLAKQASLDGGLATIDLKSASDTVSKVLVKLLMPADWYELMNSLRTPRVKLGNGDFFLEKFASMGNGFTFELETLIFFAIATSCCEEKRVYVYGDDIICPTEHASYVVKALEFFGFTINGQKSFLSGPFRESCGGDFFDGVDVRPYFMKRLPTEPSDWISIANGIRRLATFDDSLDPRFIRWWFSVLDAIPTDVRRCRGPAYLGDIVIHDISERWHTKIRGQVKHVQAWLPAVVFVWPWWRFPPSALLAAALYGATLSQVGQGSVFKTGTEGFAPRNAPVTGFRKAWVPAE